MKHTKGEAPNSLARSAMEGVHPPLYRRAKNRNDAEDFTRHILDFEKERGHPKTYEEASEIFRILRFKGYIIHDPLTGSWRGSDIPSIKESFGLETHGKRAEKSKGSHRSKFGKITARSKDELIDEIQRIEDCDRSRATTIFRCGKNNKSVKPVFVYDKPTNTWRGHLADPPTMANTATSLLTKIQRGHWELFGKMPWLNHDRLKLEESDAITWTCEKASVDREAARRLIDNAFHSCRDKSKIPLLFRTLDGVKQIGGKEYVEPFRLTEEVREKLLNMAGVAGHELNRAIKALLNLKDSQVDEAIELAFGEELLVDGEVTITNKVTREESVAIGGKKWYDELLAKELAKQNEARKKKAEKEAQQAAEREKLEAERKEQERLDREMEEINRRIVSLVNKLRGMPKLTEGEAIKWIKDSQDDQLGGFDPVFFFRRALLDYKTITATENGGYRGIDYVEPLKLKAVTVINSRHYVDPEFGQEERERREIMEELALSSRGEFDT
jgi:hypothetical protein